MGVIGELAGYVFFVGLKVAFFNVDLDVAANVLLGADAHGGIGGIE